MSLAGCKAQASGKLNLMSTKEKMFMHEDSDQLKIERREKKLKQ